MTFSQKSRNFSGTRIIIALLSLQRLGPRPSKFAALLVFLIFKTSKKLFKTSRLQFDNCLFGPEKFLGLSRKEPHCPTVLFSFPICVFLPIIERVNINKLANGSQRICDFTTKRWLFAAEMYYIYREKNSMHFSRYELPRTDARD